jgi:hypothetical protein
MGKERQKDSGTGKEKEIAKEIARPTETGRDLLKD